VLYGYQLIGSGGAHPASLKAMLEFAAKHDIKPTIEKFPLTKQGVIDAMQKLRDGKVRYRGVLEV
jgi:D-arabinose 1-dehydrogenase-like Zn-dependent alcohol dehydrogenase